MRYNLRMSRNKLLQTPMSLLLKFQEPAKKIASYQTGVKPQNFKKDLILFIEKLVKSDPIRMDSREQLPILGNIEANNFEGVRNLIYRTDKMSGLGTKVVMELLESRNFEGLNTLLKSV